jgi:hypothetical protein
MLLVVPSPTPSPINVNVSIAPDAALDTYTGVLAAATIVLAVFTVLLAVIGWRALKWQRREIEHTQRQLELATTQFENARRTARPQLEVVSQAVSMDATRINIVYVTGTEPAYDVAVWGKIQAPNITSHQGDRVLQAMTADRSPKPVAIVPLTLDEKEPVGPFAELVEPRITLLENESWFVVTWRAADGTRGRWGYIQRLGGRTELIWNSKPSVSG